MQQLITLHETWNSGKEIGVRVFDNSLPQAQEIDEIIPDQASPDDSSNHFEIQPQCTDIIQYPEVMDDVPFETNTSGIINRGVACAIVASIAGKDIREPCDDEEDLLFNTDPSGIKDCLTSIVDTVVSRENDLDSKIKKGLGDHQVVTLQRLKTITVPPALKKKGRPKGSDQTNVIGLCRIKKMNKPGEAKRFIDLRLPEKEKFILLLCVGVSVSTRIISSGSKRKIEESDVDPTEINAGIFNDRVNPNLVKYLFSDNAWILFENYYNEKMKLLKYRCSSCFESDESYDNLVTCDHCMQSFHHQCVKLKKTVRKRASWFCNPCKAEAKSNIDSLVEDEIENDDITENE